MDDAGFTVLYLEGGARRRARVAESVDAGDSKSPILRDIRVRVSSRVSQCLDSGPAFHPNAGPQFMSITRSVVLRRTSGARSLHARATLSRPRYDTRRSSRFTCCDLS